MAAGQLSCSMDPPAPDVGGVVGRRLVPRHLLLPHPQPPSPSCLSCPIIHVSKSCQEAALLAPNEPATQNSPITWQNNSSFIVRERSASRAWNKQCPRLCHPLDEKVEMLGTVAESPNHQILQSWISTELLESCSKWTLVSHCCTMVLLVQFCKAISVLCWQSSCSTIDCFVPASSWITTRPSTNYLDFC